MLSTPEYFHFNSKDYEKFYEPSEDTFLFLDALEIDINYLNALKPLIVAEIGCGSGVVINFLAKHLENSKRVFFLATDLNENACSATKLTSEKNSNDVNLVNCDLLKALMFRLEGSVDVLLFNPPYVVTEREELGAKDLKAAWAGGENGREVMDRLFPFIDKLLSANGVFYLVCIKQNRIDEIEQILKTYGFRMTIVIDRKAGIEHLFILRFNRIVK